MSKTKTETELKPLEYVIPHEAGLASEGKAICKRLGELLDALGNINEWVVKGPITQECWEFRTRIIKRLKAEGWEVHIPKNNFKVKLPKDYYERPR